jgi:hypothetical protein
VRPCAVGVGAPRGAVGNTRRRGEGVGGAASTSSTSGEMTRNDVCEMTRFCKNFHGRGKPCTACDPRRAGGAARSTPRGSATSTSSTSCSTAPPPWTPRCTAGEPLPPSSPSLPANCVCLQTGVYVPAGSVCAPAPLHCLLTAGCACLQIVLFACRLCTGEDGVAAQTVCACRL